MVRPSDVLIETFIDHLKACYDDVYGSRDSEYRDTVVSVARMALSRIAQSNSLYYDVEHAIHLTMVGNEMLYGQLARSGSLPAQDWVHFLCAVLCSGVGRVRGACRGDRDASCAIDPFGKAVVLPRGATDAALGAHVGPRSAMFVREHFQGHPVIDAKSLASDIERSNVLVSLRETQAGTTAGRLRAAQVIGTLSDPDFERKLPAFFLAAEEAGIAKHLGFENLAEVREKFARFFWEQLYPNTVDGTPLLAQTGYGRVVLSHMYSMLLVSEHGGELVTSHTR